MKYATYQDNFFERMEIRSFSSCFQVLNYVLFFNTLETIFFCDIFIRSAIKNFLGLCSQKQRKDFWVAYEKKQNCMIISEYCLNMYIYFDNSVFSVSSIMPLNLWALFLVFWKTRNTNCIYLINLWKYSTQHFAHNEYDFPGMRGFFSFWSTGYQQL